MNKQTLLMDLINIDMRSTDIVLLHTSTKKIGDIQGGPDAVLDVLMEYFSP
ncbi:MAG: AAC(3) family N-acetyltransferase [Clostridiales bacterium]|nr:AAC(3) family N-acetyltransferase [Clostridiales bacterium]